MLTRRTAETKTKTTTTKTRRADKTALAEYDRRFWGWCDLHQRAINRTEVLWERMQAAGPEEAPAVTRRWHRAWNVSQRCLDRIHFYQEACTAIIRAEEIRP